MTARGSKPATRAAIVGSKINATGGITTFLIKQKIKTATITKPIIASLLEGAAAFFAGAFAGFNMSVKVLYSSARTFEYSEAFA